VNLERRKRFTSPEWLFSRLGRFYGLVIRDPRTVARWLVGHPRRAMAWLLTTVVGSLWLLAAAGSHVAGAIFQRAATAVMQPLTVDHQVTALQATTITYMFGAPLYVALLMAARRRLKESRLRDAVPHTERRDRILSGLSRATQRFSPAHRLLSRVIETERKHRWVLTVLPFLIGFVSANLLAQFYAARLPFSAGNAITTLGPIAMAMVIAWREDRKGLPLLLPLMSAVGAALMIPWGQRIDGLGVLAALCGAVSSAVMVSGGKAMAHARILLKGTGLSMVAGLLLGAPSLLLVHWTGEVVVRGIIAGLLVIAGSVLYWLAQATLHLPKRLAGALTANGPALSGLVGLGVLHQSIGAVSVIGIAAILVASVLNAALTGSKDERAAEVAKYNY
jgi:threonine/homoserine efflux transporter RhtA